MAYSTAPQGSIPPGIRLSAAEALLNGQSTFTRAQVAVLISLAFEAGMRTRLEDDQAELICVWADHHEARPTYDQRIAQRHAEMAAGAERERRRPRTGVVDLSDVDWPPVAVPGRPR